jgi:RimJ/RimL family protein N-acetyltransferase
MKTESPVLLGEHIRLEPLGHHHVEGLAAAAAADRSLYQWSPVPQGKAEATTYVNTALAWRDAGSAVPFAIVTLNDSVIIGSTRFWNIERWAWPPGNARYNRQSPLLAKDARNGAPRPLPDACEIGYTWLARSAIRTAANTEAKLLMLTHAFETWKVLRVCFHTDSRNQRSRAALERIGAKFEGILRAHRMAADYIPRDSMRYSIVEAEWPDVKQRLSQRLRKALGPG